MKTLLPIAWDVGHRISSFQGLIRGRGSSVSERNVLQSRHSAEFWTMERDKVILDVNSAAVRLLIIRPDN